MRRRHLLAVAATGLSAGSAGCIQISRKEAVNEERFRPPEGALSVVSEADDVSVEAVDADEIRTTLRKRYGAQGPPDVGLQSSRSGGDLTLTVPEPGGTGLFGTEVDLEVAVPADTAVDPVRTDDGDVAVSGIGSGVDAETDDGDVVVDDTSGDVHATAEDGDVSVDGVSGFVTAATDDGDVVVEDVGGVDGLTSAAGDVVADLPAVRGDVRVSTEDGDVTARLGSTLDATVAVVTDRGDLAVPEDVFDAAEEDTESYVRGRVGEGTHTLRIQTRRGDVTLSRL